MIMMHMKNYTNHSRCFCEETKLKKLAYKDDINLTDTVVALGKFEGLHKGHMLLLHKVLQISHEEGKESVVVSIDKPETKRICTIAERDEIFEKIGIDYNITCEFNKKFASIKPEAFIMDFVNRLHPSCVIVGKDFRFGKNRQGDVSLLTSFGNQYGFSVIAYEKLQEDHVVISSSYIRTLLDEGNVSKADRFLGRPYSIEGIVQHGKQLGRTIGFPTANLIPQPDKYMVQNGVYATEVVIDGTVYKGVTNVGENPTVDTDHKIKVETNVLSLDENLYGKYIKVNFLQQIRKEMKFDSIQDLKNQIKSDTIEIMHQ